MAVSGKKINELEAVTTLTDDSVLPTVVINDTVPETTAKKVSISQLNDYIGSKVLPDQTGQSGKVLTTDGTDASWQDPTGGVTSVNTKTGDVVLTGEDIKIDSLSNTTITSALDDKQDTADITTDIVSTSITLSTLAYNTVYQFGTIDSLTISALPSDYASSDKRYQESVIYFTSGSSGTNITMPAGLSWVGGVAPSISGGMAYIISICNGLIAIGPTSGGGGGGSIPTLTWYTGNTGTTLTIEDTTSSPLVKIYKNGILLQEGVGNDYTISGTTLTLSSALVSADKITTEIF